MTKRLPTVAALQHDVATGAAGDPPGQGQAEPGAAVVAAGVTGLEDQLALVGRDAGAVVVHGDRDVAGTGLRPGDA